MKKPLTPQEFLVKENENKVSISTSRILHQSENLTCPYDKCGKRFAQPVVLTDLSKTPRETYYACPYCFSKLEIALKSKGNLNSVSVKSSAKGNVTTPEKCSHYFGFLTTLQKGDSMPEECLTCQKLIQCTIKK